jgi:hypothetical protein
VDFVFGILGSPLDDTAVVDHASYTAHRESATREAKEPYLVLVRKVFDDELVDADTFIPDSTGSRAIVDIFEECPVEAYTFLVSGNNVFCWKMRVRYYFVDSGFCCGGVVVVHRADHVGQLADVAFWRARDFSFPADPSAIAEDDEALFWA